MDKEKNRLHQLIAEFHAGIREWKVRDIAELRMLRQYFKDIGQSSLAKRTGELINDIFKQIN